MGVVESIFSWPFAYAEHAVYREAVNRWLQCGCWFVDGGCSIEAIRVKVRLAENHYYWTGVLWRDYVFHVANSHPLLGIFFCHPLHSYNKVERLFVEWLSFVGTAAWVVLCSENLRLHNMQFNDGQHDIQDQIYLYIFVTAPLDLCRTMLERIALESGRPHGCLEQAIGERCVCALECWLMSCCCWLVLIATSMCVFVIATPGPWNQFGKDSDFLQKTYKLSQVSILQGWLSWFVYDLIMPTTWCPLTFGFCWQWRNEKDKEKLPDLGLSNWSSSFSGSSSGEEDCCLRKVF